MHILDQEEVITMKTGSSNRDKIIEELKNDQKNFKDEFNQDLQKNIGNPWVIYVPTDGTHVECVLGASTAADEHTTKQIDAAIDSIKSP